MGVSGFPLACVGELPLPRVDMAAFRVDAAVILPEHVVSLVAGCVGVCGVCKRLQELEDDFTGED